MSPDPLRRLDLLVASGVITGYTLEPSSDYLEGHRPVLTYSTYEAGDAERRHLSQVIRAMSEAGGRVTVHRRRGTVHDPGCPERLQRRRELMAVARFGASRDLGVTLDRLSDPRFPVRWRYPDLRVCGPAGAALLGAHAHSLTVAGGSAVVLSLSSSPPLPDMSSHSVGLLPCWGSYLASPPTAPLAAAPGRDA